MEYWRLTLVNEHEGEYTPEELGSLGSETAVKVQGLESIGERDLGGEDRVGRLDGEVGQHSGHTVPDQLRGEQGEDGDSSVHLVVVEQILYRDDLNL